MYTPVNEMIKKLAVNWVNGERKNIKDNSEAQRIADATVYAFENFSVSRMRRIYKSFSLLQHYIAPKFFDTDISEVSQVAQYIRLAFSEVLTDNAVWMATAESARRNDNIRRYHGTY